MTLPPALLAFSSLPFWNSLFMLLALSIAAFSGWALWRRRGRQDLYYLLLGLYLAATQTPIVFPSLGQALGGGLPIAGSGLGFLLAAPAVVLFVLGVRAK